MTGGRTDPHLLTSGRSAALLDGSGDLTLLQESRGAVSDWGGVYARHVRLTGPWSLTFRDDEHRQRLGEGAAEFVWEPYRATGRHRLSEFPDLTIVQRVAAVADPPGVLRTIEISTTGAGRGICVESAFPPFLAPVMVEGIRPGRFPALTRADGLFLRQHGFGLYESTRPAPTRRYLGRASWIGGHYQGPISEVGTEHQLQVDPGRPAQISYWIGGGRTSELGREEEMLRPLLDDPGAALSASERFWSSWEDRTPRMRFPQAPWLETAYDQARRSLRALYSRPEGGLAGLVAGYPWYASLWCRDLAEMLPAVLWLGDFDQVRASIETVFRFQPTRDLPMLGARKGSLPMQISTGPVLLYGTADTPLYYPGLVERYLLHSGEPTVPEAWARALDGIVGWARARQDASNGLLTHGHEVEDLIAATSAVARVRFGIDQPDTTIWDSADRRDQAIDIQVLWHQALGALGRMARGSSPARIPASELERIAETIRQEYRWPEEAYLADSLRAGQPVRTLRPNA
ncbi:MAG: amylo-alpha-1,6-glucosidase, partial [Thermoplasmata archaeon]